MRPEDLKAGDILIATEDAYFKTGEQSQFKGHLLMVNNPKIGDSVGGTGLNGLTYQGCPRIGLGCSFRYGTFRRATPSDPGYMATREAWQDHKDDEIRSLRDKNFQLRAVLVLTLWALFLLMFN